MYIDRYNKQLWNWETHATDNGNIERVFAAEVLLQRR